ncbi:unnamed protein product [Rotaria sordida]|uniref:MYND-type domain-containing protein n=1 Tax=Rotaria sordida TaxID=392033 RepID=A0A819SK28_9BILA|nr:unnamed protein product [Rotaria sordida]CAF0877505.1 unnamed protein product [Rotaria sordida]CAF1026985.1 unnamed protein product [Rotaria sordida]CAF1151829.1 unnamed protein product [Rotaria sordida]CAF4013481.1 unnamed protein product [Rotaria sordida]
MAHISSGVRNYFKLELLIASSCISLRQLFKNRYSLFNNGQVWDNSSTCGNNYLKVITKYKNLSLTGTQKTSVSNGNSDEWDVTTFMNLLLYIDRPKPLNTTEIQQLDEEDKLLKQLKDIRNKLVHHSTKSVDDVEFNQLWTDLSAILVTFGSTESELDKLKDDSIFESPKQPINEQNVKEASHLNSLGTKAHKDRKYLEAITLFMKAIVLAGVSNHNRAIFYSNLAASRLSLYEQETTTFMNFEINGSTDERYRALKDAKQARNLWPTWWRGHFRVGKVYAALNEYEKAINSFERAFALDPMKKEIQEALDDSRQILSQQSRHEHLDPEWSPKTIPEYLNDLKQKFGVEPEEARIGHSLAGLIYPSGADVIEGLKYVHGDIGIKQDYAQAAKYFAKAARQSNAEGICNLALLTDRGLGVKKDHNLAFKLYEQAATQPLQHPVLKNERNFGVAEAEHTLGLKYADGITVHKNLLIAAHYFQRAIDHGLPDSANNLGLMYHDGLGVDKDLAKAEQLFQLAAKNGNSGSMLSLAKVLLDRNDLQMSKIWFDRACDAGNIQAQSNRSTFEKILEEKQKFIGSSSPNILKVMDEITNIIDFMNVNPTSCESFDQTIYDYNILNDYANRGSKTARKLCNALEHFQQAFKILMESDSLTEEQENTFVHELSQCYRIEQIVAQYSGMEIRQKIVKIVEGVLYRCKTQSIHINSQLDEDARNCYATLHLDSYELILKFLDLCKQNYPKSARFFELSASANGFLKRFEAALYETNQGLEIDPNNDELLYFKAVALRLMDHHRNEAIEAYQKFLEVAPNDHRYIPESFYEMATCYLKHNMSLDEENIIKNLYRQGEEAEKLQLPCFLPYKSTSKTLLKFRLYNESLPNTKTIPDNNPKLRLTDPHRVEVITHHREWESQLSKAKSNENTFIIPKTHQPSVKQPTVKSLIGLKPITLREMNPAKNHVYNGYVLSVTIIEKAYSSIPSIQIIIEDENLDCQRMYIYGFPEEQSEYLINKVYTNGRKMLIINPYLRIGAKDRKPSIRVDDFSSITMLNESERIINMCRCCGKANSSHVCSQCKQAYYCSKECQIMDWKLYKHKLICQIE